MTAVKWIRKRLGAGGKEKRFEQKVGKTTKGGWVIPL
jgi:hypothetical protein